MRRASLPTAAFACAMLVALASGCSVTPEPPGDGPTDSVRMPPVGAAPDYQLGGAYGPAEQVGIVGRDRTAEPASDAYSICYVNAFQTQPSELDQWPEDLLLRIDGDVVFDPEWPDEALLDTSTDARRERIARIVRPWIVGCAEAGFDAVEFDNLDSYTRSEGLLAGDDNLALAAALVDAAHRVGLAAGQKNAAEDASVLRERAGFDFALVEECAAYEECDAFTAVYGEHVIDIEYTDWMPRSFAEMCAAPSAPASMVLRDRDLLPAGEPGHVFAVC